MRHVLLLERDLAGRALVQRVLGADGITAKAVGSIAEAPASEPFLAAIVDELAGSGGVLEELRAVRARYPTLPIVLTGTLLSASVLREAIRVGIVDALPKPFTPAELREAVAHALEQALPNHDDALEFAGALSQARLALASGRLVEVRGPLARAHALAPLDAEPMALEALVAEITGRDEDADRGYRAALALRHDEGTLQPHPLDGLARLAAYGDARPVDCSPEAFRGAPSFLVGDAAELGTPPGALAHQKHVALVALGLDDRSSAVYLRAGSTRAFALLTASRHTEDLQTTLDTLGMGNLVTQPNRAKS